MIVKKLFLFSFLFIFSFTCYGQVVGNGDTFSVTIPVKNDGPRIEYAAQAKINIPSGISYISNTVTAGSYSESDSTWYIGALPIGVQRKLTLNFEVTDITEFPVVVESYASGVGNDTDLSNNDFADTIYWLIDSLEGIPFNFSYANLRGNVLDNDSLCNFCSTKVSLAAGSEANGEVIYFDGETGDYRFVLENPNEDGYFSYDLTCYDCGDGLSYFQGTATEVIPKLFTDSLFGGGGGIESCCPDTFAQNLIVEEIDTTTKKIIIPLSSGDTLEAMFTDYRGSAGTGDDWGAQTVQSDASLSGNGTAGSPLEVNFPYKDTSDQNELQSIIAENLNPGVASAGISFDMDPLGPGGSFTMYPGTGITFNLPFLPNPGQMTIENTAPFPGFTTVFGDYGENAESTTVTDGETIDLTLSTFDITGEVILDPTPSNILSSSASGLLAEAADTSNVNEAQSLNPTDVGGDPAAQLTQAGGIGGGTIIFDGGTDIGITRSGNIYTFNNLAPFPGFTNLLTDYGVDISLYSTLQDLADTATSIRNDELHAEQLLIEELTDSTRQIKIVLNNGDTVQSEMSINPPAPEVVNYYTLDMTVAPSGDTVGVGGSYDASPLNPSTGTFNSTIEMAIPNDAFVVDWVVHVDTTIIPVEAASQAKVNLVLNPYDGAAPETVSYVTNVDFNKNLKLSGTGYPVVAGGSLGIQIQAQNRYVVGMHVSVTLAKVGIETNTVTVPNNYTPPAP